MTDSDNIDNFTSVDDGDMPEPLVKWERICALVIGVICGGAGGYAVFERSNQAGSAMLLILAGIFLLIGVQGTPLIKFGSNSGNVELERRRRRKVQEALEQANEDDNSEKAEGIVEGIKLVAPDLVPESYNTYMQYEANVVSALIGLGYELSQQVHVRQLMIDLEIKKGGRKVYAELRYYRGSVSAQAVQQIIGIATVLSAPVLLVANSQLTNSARTLIGPNDAYFVQWRGEEDNNELHAALERLFADVNSGDGGKSVPNGSG